MGFDFGQVNGKRFTSNSWVADENAWNINDSSIKPLQPLPVSRPQSTWDKIKAFDFSPRRIVNQLGQGLAQGLSQTGTAKQDIGIANVLANSKLPAIAEQGRKQQEVQQAQKEYLEANPVNSIPAAIGEQIPQIPLWMAGQLGVTAVGKGINKLAPSLAGKVDKLPGIVKGGLVDAATYGGVVAPVDSIRKGEDFGQFLDREKQLPGVFLGGAGVRGAGNLIGKGLKGAKSVLSPRGVPQLPPPTTTPPTLPRMTFRPPNEVPTTASIQRPLSRLPVREQAPIQPRLGQELPRAGSPTNNLNSPLQNSMPRERQFAQNVRDSQVAPGAVKQNTLDNQLTYEPITNKETLAKANLEVSTDAVKARAKFDAPSKGISADDVALGESLIVKAIKDGNTAEANLLIADLAEKLTQAGQAVQAASIFKRLTPEGMLLYAQRVVNSANKDILKRLGPNAPKVELTAEDSRFITDTMRRMQTLEGEERKIAMAQIEQLIKNKVPPTLADKIMAIQRMSLLLNPKTMVRNVLGNTIFGVIDNVSNVVATPIDIATSKLLKTPRTTTIPSLKGQLKSAIEGVKITRRDAKLGIDTYNNRTQYEFSGKKNFTGEDIYNRTLDRLDRATITGLKYGDTPFHKAAYDESIRQQTKLAGISKPTPAMEEQASKIAQQRTYQDVNAMTEGFRMAQKALNKISSGLGVGNADFGLGNIVMPFVKTPANILKRAVEYSPVGITTAIKEATKKGKGTFDQKAFVDSISRSVTGTAIIMVGYDLAKKGIITGSGNKDKDVASFERGLGKNDYAFKVDDNLYTYDWMQPASMSLAIGADIYLKGKDRKEAENVVINAVRSGGETLFKQSVLQGVTRFLSGYDPIDSVAKTTLNAPTQFFPTVGKQISQAIDPVQRSTYNPSNIGTAKNLLKSRTPGLTSSLEPKINTSGETVQAYQGKNNLFNIFANPGSATEFKPNDVQKEILRIYEATGDKNVFPKLAPKSLTIKGESFKLTPKEITTFQQTLGKTTEARMRALMRTKQDDEKRAKEFADAIEKAYNDARTNFLAGRGIK